MRATICSLAFSSVVAFLFGCGSGSEPPATSPVSPTWSEWKIAPEAINGEPFSITSFSIFSDQRNGIVLVGRASTPNNETIFRAWRHRIATGLTDLGVIAHFDNGATGTVVEYEGGIVWEGLFDFNAEKGFSSPPALPAAPPSQDVATPLAFTASARGELLAARMVGLASMASRMEVFVLENNAWRPFKTYRVEPLSVAGFTPKSWDPVRAYAFGSEVEGVGGVIRDVDASGIRPFPIRVKLKASTTDPNTLLTKEAGFGVKSLGEASRSLRNNTLATCSFNSAVGTTCSTSDQLGFFFPNHCLMKQQYGSTLVPQSPEGSMFFRSPCASTLSYDGEAERFGELFENATKVTFVNASGTAIMGDSFVPLAVADGGAVAVFTKKDAQPNETSVYTASRIGPAMYTEPAHPIALANSSSVQTVTKLIAVNATTQYLLRIQNRNLVAIFSREKK